MLDLRPKDRRFEPHRRHCVVSLSKDINPSFVLVQPRKTCPCITERLLMGCKESNQTKYLTYNVYLKICIYLTMTGLLVRLSLNRIMNVTFSKTVFSLKIDYIIEPWHGISNSVVCATAKPQISLRIRAV